VGVFAITRMGEKSSSTAAEDNAPHYDAAASEPDYAPNYEAAEDEMGAAPENGNMQNVGKTDFEDFLNSITDRDKAESSTKVEDYHEDSMWEGAVSEEVGTSLDFLNYDLTLMRLEIYPNDYEELLQTDAFVVTHGRIEAGLDKWEAFFEKSQEGIPAYVDLVEFTEEGDAIITALIYNGETYHVVMDCTRDAFGNTGIVEHKYKYLYTDTFDDRTEVVLSDLKLEGEEVREAILSDGTDVYYLVNYEMD
jgi:hypothetical protein